MVVAVANIHAHRTSSIIHTSMVICHC